MSSRFQSWLAPQFERFVQIKRAGGADYRTQERLLAQFDCHLLEHAPKPPLRRETLVDFLKELGRLSPRGRDNVVSVVWQAVAFSRTHDAKIDSLPPRPPRAPSRFRQRPIRLVSDEEIRAIIAQARRLPRARANQLCPATYATLYGLLYATGIRIGEALALDIGDLDLHDGLLTVHRGKFDKSRVLPLRSSTVAALQRYVNDPRRQVGRTAAMPLFVSIQQRRLECSTAYRTFKSLCTAAGIAHPLPRQHDLRHSFAVQRVVAWYQQNRDVNALLPALSTYLGHVSVENTRTYLQANGLLFEQASKRFSARAARLDEVLT
jgi:integrase